ncbi:MAG: DNA-directed DNA polymerase [Candidatus Nanohaloarchaeota archaeon QJJ-7]|nr:DNA-directed DNA polymerase [Candidatus Nanohaloarchaeota archaeon QJJ-7]
MDKVEATVLEADYVLEGGEAVVRIFGKDSEGEPIIARDRSFEPYSYVLGPDMAAIKEEIGDGVRVEGETIEVDFEEVGKTLGREEQEVLKLVLEEPPDVPKVREKVEELGPVRETREFDIPFYKRYLIDRGVKPGKNYLMEGELNRDEEPEIIELEEPLSEAEGSGPGLSSLAFDLEVYEEEVIMCSFYSEDFQKVLVKGSGDFDADYVETVGSEENLLERILEIVEERDPDIFLGYNTDEFDFDVLRDRTEKYGLELDMSRTGEEMKFKRRGRFSGANLEGRVHLDLYAFVENVVSMGLQSDVLTLDAVAEELIGENKDELPWEEMRRLWEEKEELDRFAKYALRDSELAYLLGETLVPQMLSLSRLTGLPPFDVCRHTYGQLVENFLLRKSYERNILSPNRPSQSERSERYKEGRYAGGFVYEPEEGLHEDIALFDFRSLYPTIMVSHNLSPDTLEVEGCEDELNVEIEEADRSYSFCQDEPGFIPSILESLVEERYELKGEMNEVDEGSQEYRDIDNRQQALKILSNAFYGYMGYNGARWYSRESAEATTALGRQYIQETIEKAEEMGFEVVYGDTDSVMVKGGEVEGRIDEFQDEVNSSLPEFMELEFEGFYPRGLFTYTESGGGAKKKYALIDRDGNVKITGFEQVRRDWSRVAKDAQEEVIRRVLEGEVEEAVEIVKETVDELRSGEVPLEKLKIYTQMKKKPENYESKTPHSEAAKRAIKRGKDIDPGDTIAYVVTRGDGPISDRSEVLTYAEDYDPDYYVQNQVVPVAIRVLKVLGYTEDQLLGKGKQTGIGDFS